MHLRIVKKRIFIPYQRKLQLKGAINQGKRKRVSVQILILMDL